MLITNTVTKKVLETIIHETFSSLGNLSSSSLLDSLKLLGFYYATNAGISINIEDLKTPKVKKEFISAASSETEAISELWEQGFVSDAERFQRIIDGWNYATEALKNRIINYYLNFDPANNLYIMAFSGARGNMSQVRQLVGMRGLMSDQEGKIIDLPIQTNFREGLSSIDYMISSYGARKGIVDTALKTADSGYLTRRLIYVAQDLIIREIDCRSFNGLIFLLNQNTNIKNILGRFLISAKEIKTNKVLANYENKILTKKNLNLLKKEGNLLLNIRSPLTCISNGSICQTCYGWDLAQEKMISLGEAVGIISAQSIGEPGTQLTMRTFHTGGIFTSETLKQTLAPFTGNVLIPRNLKGLPYRTTHGNIVLKLKQEAKLVICSWDGNLREIFLEIGAFLYVTTSSFIKKGTLISEQPTRSIVSSARRLKPIYASIDGEIRFESLFIRHINRDSKPKVKVNQDDGVLWVAAGKVISLPKEVKYMHPKTLRLQKVLARLQICAPHAGLFTYSFPNIIIQNDLGKFKLNLAGLVENVTNCRLSLSIITKNYQNVDSFTTLAYLNVYPEDSERIHIVRKKESSFKANYFIVGDSNTWSMSSDRLSGYFRIKDAKATRAGNLLNETTQASQSGFLIKKDGLNFIFQKAMPIFVGRGTILNSKQGDFVFQKELLATLVNYTQQTEDIVQGLPKIEELIEARAPKAKSELAVRPGVLLSTRYSLAESSFLMGNNLILNIYANSAYSHALSAKNESVKAFSTLKNRPISIIHSICADKDFVFYDNKMWKASPVPPGFFPFRLMGKNELCFVNNKGSLLIIGIKGKKTSAGWIPKGKPRVSCNLYKRSDYGLRKILSLTKANFIFQNKKSNDIILKLNNETYLFLEQIDPITKYALPLNAKLLAKPGAFVDIGEPITEGLADPHELLSILFRYHSDFDGIYLGTLRSLNKFQLLLVNAIQGIYQSQGVSISSKHVEVIVRQMTSKVLIKHAGDTPLLPGELIRLALALEIYKALILPTGVKPYKVPQYEPLFLSATSASLSKDGFLSSSGFQETKRVLTKAAIEGTSDWLRGLKECILLGRLIPAGSSFLNYKNYLDNIYLFKD